MAEQQQPAVQRREHVPFQAHVELLQLFLARRGAIVERVQALLNAQRKPAQYWQDGLLHARQLEDCFFAGVTAEQSTLKRQLDEAHWTAGFKPRRAQGLQNDLIDAAEMMGRAFHMWQQTRWPGQLGRVHYAQTLFNLYLLRRLMLLAMRIWDAGAVGERLTQVQRVLDELWQTAPADQPVLVRDARWLLPLALSPTTDELHGYFEVARRVAETLSPSDVLEIDAASVRLAGGHLRSQLRHVAVQKGVSLDDHSLILSTRRSNALDLATLIQGLVPLLAAYEHASGERRLALADPILQGVSPDPELFLNRLDLLGAYSMIEYLFIATDAAGHARYTPMGERHLRLLAEYQALIARVSSALREDCPRFRPVERSYSPYGVLFGFSSQLLEHMALKASQPDASTRFTLEDVFVGGDADKLAWVTGWRKLPHVPREVAKRFEYPRQFAVDVYARIERALRKPVAAAIEPAITSGRLFAVVDGAAHADERTSAITDVPLQFILSSDRRAVVAQRAQPCQEAQLLHSRQEGELLVSYETPGGWIALTKDVLTEVLGAGRHAKIVGLPRDAANVLRLMCSGVVVVE